MSSAQGVPGSATVGAAKEPATLTVKRAASLQIFFHVVGTTGKVTDIYSLEFCFPFKPNKRLHYPMALTNVTDHYVGIWITRISANSWVNKSLEDPCSFFLIYETKFHLGRDSDNEGAATT